MLTDEINRATPKTQSALLEAMEERQVTVDGVTHEMARPFMVLATQNPIEYEGTFPLPEAQIDRFMMRLHLGYPARANEIDVLTRQVSHHPIQDMGQIVSVEELVAAQRAVRTIYVDELVKGYIVDLVNTPRVTIAMFTWVRVRAAAWRSIWRHAPGQRWRGATSCCPTM